VKWLVTDVYGLVGEERAEFVRARAGGLRPEGIRTGPPLPSSGTPVSPP
jgi:hypothetical protein